MRRSSPTTRSSGSSWPATRPARLEWTDRVPKLGLPALFVAAALVCGGAVMASVTNYKVTMVMANANNLFKGSSVLRNGFKAGKVTDIKVVDGKARVTLD